MFPLKTLLSHRSSRVIQTLLIVIAFLICVVALLWTQAFASPRPRVIAWTPGPKNNIALDSAIQLSFDQTMDPGSVSSAFHISPTIPGRFNVVQYTYEPIETSLPSASPLTTSNTSLPMSVVSFTPEKPFDKATRYQISLDTSARTQNGQTLIEPFAAMFTTTGQLHVDIIPTNRSTGVATNTHISLLFGATMPSDSKPVLSITPSISSSGEWSGARRYVLNTSGLQPATRYSARLASGLIAVNGDRLIDDTVITFTTTLPRVTDHEPKGKLVASSSGIRLDFNLPVDRTSVKSRFALLGADAHNISGTIAWPDDMILIFTPDVLLLEEQTYTITLDAGVRTPLGELSSDDNFVSSFRIAPRPELIGSTPNDGNLKATPRDRVTLRFSVPMETSTVERALRIEPAPEIMRYDWNDNNTTLDLVYDIDPTALYTLAFSDGAIDFLNRPLGGNRSIVFQFGPQESVTWLVGPNNYWNTVYGTYNPEPQVRQYTQFRNVDQITYQLSSITQAKFLSSFKSNGYGERTTRPSGTHIFSWTQTVSASLNHLAFASTEVTLPDGSPLSSGVYLLDAEGTPGHAKDWRMLIVSPFNLTLKRSDKQIFVWATDLRNGQPIDGLALTVYDQDRKVVTRGVTNTEGVFSTSETPECLDQWECLYGWRPLYVIAEADSGEWGFVASNWDQGITTRDFRMPYYYGEPSHTIFLYTDRPIYRPDQTVYFKGAVRRDDDGRYQLPEFTHVPVVIEDAQGNEIYREDLPLSDMGTFFGEIDLSDEAPLGSYRIEVQYDEETYPAYGNFRVAEYRKPEFKVSIMPSTFTPLQDEVLTITVQADYYFGAPLPDATVEWRLSSDDYRYSIPREWYSFSDVNEYYWLWGEDSDRGDNIYANGTGTTDANGTFTFTVPIDLAQAKRGQILSFEADVIDQNQQVTSARGYAVAHKTDLYVGVRPRRYVARIDQPLTIQLVAADLQKNKVPNVPITLELYERNWRSARLRDNYGIYYWNSTYSDTLISTQVVTTALNGLVDATVVPPLGGQYRVVARIKDTHGVETIASAFFWTPSKEYVNWGVQNDDRINIIPDKRTYQPGETAQLLITAPFADSTALVSVERGGVLRYWAMPVTGTSALIDVPIHADYAPNAFINVILLKGQAPDFEAADFKIGYVALNVELTEQQLNVELIPDKPRYAPRDTATYTVRVTDHLGQPVDAEVSLSLIDAAVLALVGDEDQDILTTFYRQRGLGVHNSLTLVTSVDRLTSILDKKAKGGGGGGDVTERDLFADTAFWRAAVRTGPTGETTIRVPLPDNLTTWRMRAKAIGSDTRLGQTEVDVIATQDIILRPVLPRFFTIGDNARLGAIVHNYTPFTETLRVHLDFAQQVGIAAQEVNIAPNGSAPVYWNVSVPRTTSVTLRLQALTTDGRGDAIRLSLPVNAYLDRVTYTSYQAISDTASIKVALPQDVDRDRDELVIEVEPTLAASIDSGLEYLVGFPYGCVEQTMSSFLPDVVVLRLIQQTGIDIRPGFRAQLGDMIESGMQRLYGYQHNDGGWGWWEADESNPSITAYVLYGLFQMELGGRSIDPRVRSEAVAFLNDWLQRTSIDTPIGPTHGADAVSNGANVRAYALYVLAELGYGNPGLNGRLYEQRDKLQTYGKAYLALALYLTNGRSTDARIETLLQEIRTAATREGSMIHWIDRQHDYWGMSTSTRTTAIAIDALVRISIGDPLIEPAVRWLLSKRREGSWNTTQETSLSLVALTDYLVATFEREGDYTYTVRVNGDIVATETITPQALGKRGKWIIPLSKLAGGDPIVEISRGDGPGAPIHASISLRHYRSGEDIAAIDDQGVRVTRTYSKPLDQLRLGDVITVSLSARFDSGGTYVLLEDPLPAGLEAIDTSLATTSQQYSGGSGSWIWNHVELRDDRVALFATSIYPNRTYIYSYQARVTSAGTFYALPAQAYTMYDPDVIGRTAGEVVTVVGE